MPTSQNSFQKPLILTMGDPAGIGPEITFKAWKAFCISNKNTLTQPIYFSLYADFDFLHSIARESGYPPPVFIKTPSEAASVFLEGLPILPLGEKCQSRTPSSKNTPAILESIQKAVSLVTAGKALAMVTNPVHKACLYQAGFSFPGHTEYIADLLKDQKDWPLVRGPIMMLATPQLRISLASIHIPLKEIWSVVTKQRLIETVRITHQALCNDFAVSRPRLVFAGLNPHAGEEGKIGQEEKILINPVAEGLRKEGILISDAQPADSLFHEEARQHYDCAICLYHDQGLIPVKTLDFWHGVNITLGLPILRTSPDHGVAYPHAGKNTARADSLVTAIQMANTLAHNRYRSQYSP